MGNLNTKIDSYTNNDYYELYEKLDKIKSKAELYEIENKAYIESMKMMERRIIDIENENNELKKESLNCKNDLVKYKNNIDNYKENENKSLKENVFLTLKNNDLYIENKKMKNQIINYELDIYKYDLNYKYVKYILNQTNKKNLYLQYDLNNLFDLNCVYLKKNIVVNIINNFLKCNKKKVNNILDSYLVNKDIIISKIMLNDNTLVPDIFEKRIMKNTFNKLLKQLRFDLNH